MRNVAGQSPRLTIGKVTARLFRATGYLLGHLVSGLGAFVLLAMAVVVLALSVLGVGLILVGPLDRQVRRWCDRERVRVGRVLGRRIDSPYVGETGARFAAARAHAASGHLGCDVVVLVVRVLVGLPLAAASVMVPASAVNYSLAPFYSWALPEGETGVMFEVDSVPLAIGAALIGLCGFALWALAPAVSRADARFVAALLSPSPAQEQRRRAEMEKVRRESAVSAHSAELRRIERDLHDAAQNRLVAVALYVGMAQRQLETGAGDPGPSMDKAATAATNAIAEVRRVIQGIYPPILTEEGLVPAIGFLVDQSHIPARLLVCQPAPTPASIDAALYFSVAELLTNIAKHSGAKEATVELSWRHIEAVPWVTMVVSDDGHGGAEQNKGSGIAGVANRVKALGGSLRLNSPIGGPTRIEVDLPCEP